VTTPDGIQREPKVSSEYCAQMSELARRGSELGLAMADAATVAPGSPLQVLAQTFQLVGLRELGVSAKRPSW
jgi:hypothetical protein